jgi:2-hydroxychromene-2-carboxylate isomerase
VIAQIAAGVGCDGDALVGALDDPATKAGLREETDEAVRRGAFGAPAMFVGDRLFWGNDRLPLVERALTGRE